MKILVVDDDQVTGTLLKKLLSKHGYDVTYVLDGAEATNAIENGSYRIILTDWMMPELDGPTLCRHIRGLNTNYYIYIILLTAKSSKQDAVKGLEAGADDYIVKPFDNLELLARIRAGRRLVELEDANRRAQQKLSVSEKLAAVGHLAAGVAHEINNPIGFINSNLSSLGNYFDDLRAIVLSYRELAQALDKSISAKTMIASLPELLNNSIQLDQRLDTDYVLEDGGELIRDCQGGAERIDAIVHEMRYFAHPEKQKIEAHNLSRLIDKVVSQFTPQLPENITINHDMENIPEIQCNAPHLEKAFANLIQNALEAFDAGGTITISGGCIDNVVEIVVSDNGRGIPSDKMDSIFNPFFTTKEVGEGPGLGLTTVLNIVKMHYGYIHCQSSPGKGTSFKMGLPIKGDPDKM